MCLRFRTLKHIYLKGRDCSEKEPLVTIFIALKKYQICIASWSTDIIYEQNNMLDISNFWFYLVIGFSKGQLKQISIFVCLQKTEEVRSFSFSLAPQSFTNSQCCLPLIYLYFFMTAEMQMSWHLGKFSCLRDTFKEFSEFFLL